MKKVINTEEFISSKIGRLFFRVIQPLVDRKLGFYHINKYYNKILETKPKTSREFCDQVLLFSKTTINVDPLLKSELSQNSPVILVANHPHGHIDSMAIMQLADETSQSSWKILANQMLRNIQEMSENTIPVFPQTTGNEKAANLKAIKAIHRTLKNGETLVMFPAGRVSGRHPEHGMICDLPWSAHPLVLAIKHNVPIVFCHVSGNNSETFLSIPPEQLKKRSIALAKEIGTHFNKTLTLTHSFTMTPELSSNINRYKNKEEILRAYNYIGVDKTEAKPVLDLSDDFSSFFTDSTINYHALLSSSQEVVADYNEFTSFFFQGHEEPVVMEEVGRLRAKTFSMIGAGSGKEIDLSPEDDRYHHIVVTEKSSGKIAGAYRIGFTQAIRAEKGNGGMYLDSVFEIDPKFYNYIGDGMELSRSFIPPEFQKSPRILDILWKSVGVVANKKGCRTLYGSVTISADFTPLSQSILVDTLDRYYSGPQEVRSLIKNSNPFTPETSHHALLSDAYSEHGLNALNKVILELENQQRPIPPLMRYYSTLGAKFHSFKIEPTFGNAIYCLLTVKIDEMTPRYRKRFF